MRISSCQRLSHMNTVALDYLPLWAFFLTATALSLLAVEAGYRLGRWRHARVAGEKEEPVNAMVASILGLLAIMLAFAFSLAASRFDARRDAVLEESNRIGTAYLRARLLPQPQRAEAMQLLQEYVRVRVESVEAGTINEGITRSEGIHERLWEIAMLVAEKDPSSVMSGLFIQSLNDVIDQHNTRIMVGLRSRIPATIWISIFGLTLIGMISLGYQAGLSVTSRSPAMLFTAVATASVLFLIVDLDRAHEGLLKVSQQAMIDLQKSMNVPAS